MNCSGHGECVNGVCQCELNYVGEACDIPACPNKCNHPNGVCGLPTLTSPKGCICNDEYRGGFSCLPLKCLSLWQQSNNHIFMFQVMIVVSMLKWASGKLFSPKASSQRARHLMVQLSGKILCT